MFTDLGLDFSVRVVMTYLQNCMWKCIPGIDIHEKMTCINYELSTSVKMYLLWDMCINTLSLFFSVNIQRLCSNLVTVSFAVKTIASHKFNIDVKRWKPSWKVQTMVYNNILIKKWFITTCKQWLKTWKHITQSSNTVEQWINNIARKPIHTNRDEQHYILTTIH